jgi:flagellar basal-body rod protein FlgB
MNSFENPQIIGLEKYLDLSSRRETLIASNLANVDTPGYRTRDIHFQEELKNAMLGVDQEGASPQAYQVSGLIERPDGNNVNVDRETMLLAQTQLQFRIGIQLLRSNFHTLLTAITEGAQH